MIITVHNNSLGKPKTNLIAVVVDVVDVGAVSEQEQLRQIIEDHAW